MRYTGPTRFKRETYILDYMGGSYLVVRTKGYVHVKKVLDAWGSYPVIIRVKRVSDKSMADIRLPKNIKKVNFVDLLERITEKSQIEYVDIPKGSNLSKVFHFFDDLGGLGLNPFNQYLVYEIKEWH